jgi:hypothetical protein
MNKLIRSQAVHYNRVSLHLKMKIVKKFQTKEKLEMVSLKFQSNADADFL